MSNEIIEKNRALKTLMLSLADASAWDCNNKLIADSLAAFDTARFEQLEHIYFVGQGTSFATALCSASWGAHIARLHSQAFPGYEFTHYTDDILLSPKTSLVVGISCGGTTASVRDSLKLAKEAGAATMILSGEGEISCADYADMRVLTDSHIESRSGTKAYSISHTFLMSAAFKLCILIGQARNVLTPEQVDYWNLGFEDMIRSMSCLPDLFDKTDEAARDFAKGGFSNYVVVGAGPNLGTAQEAALKICEFSWKFCACEELEDFQHGRFREVNDDVAILITAPSGRTESKVKEIMNICSKAELGCLAVTDQVTEEMKEMVSHIIQVPHLQDEYLTPFLYTFPYWFFGYHLMENAGGKVGESRYVYQGGFIGRPENVPR